MHRDLIWPVSSLLHSPHVISSSKTLTLVSQTIVYNIAETLMTLPTIIEVFIQTLHRKFKIFTSLGQAIRFASLFDTFSEVFVRQDELCWGALWLYRATGEAKYLQMARNNYANGVSKLFSWDDKWPGSQVLMAQLTNDSNYVNDVRNYFNMLKYETRTPKVSLSYQSLLMTRIITRVFGSQSSLL